MQMCETIHPFFFMSPRNVSHADGCSDKICTLLSLLFLNLPSQSKLGIPNNGLHSSIHARQQCSLGFLSHHSMENLTLPNPIMCGQLHCWQLRAGHVEGSHDDSLCYHPTMLWYCSLRFLCFGVIITATTPSIKA